MVVGLRVVLVALVVKYAAKYAAELTDQFVRRMDNSSICRTLCNS